jgi:hypothetical protein
MEEIMRTLIDIQDDLLQELLKEADTGVKNVKMCPVIHSMKNLHSRDYPKIPYKGGS